MLLGPPMQLVALMLNIARRIAGGALRGEAFGYGEAGQVIACEWGYGDEAEAEAEAEVWTEDDYGISLRGSPAGKAGGGRDDGVEGAWEID